MILHVCLVSVRPPTFWLGWWCSWGSTRWPHHQESRHPKKEASRPAAQCPSHLLPAHQPGRQHRLPQPHQGSRSDWVSSRQPTLKPNPGLLGCVWSHRTKFCILHSALHWRPACNFPLQTSAANDGKHSNIFQISRVANDHGSAVKKYM